MTQTSVQEAIDNLHAVMAQTGIQDLLNQAYDLCAALGRAMDEVKNTTGPIQPDEWHELKIAYDAAGVAAAQLHQIARRQRAADEPIPYVLSDQTISEVARVADQYPDGIHTCAELQQLEPGRRPCTCGGNC